MPYDKVSELPDAVKKLSPKKQKAFMAAFNAAHKEYGGDEKRAFATAWASVKESVEEKPMKGMTDLLENFNLDEAMGGVQMDDANGVLTGIVLLTGNKMSLNKTYYTEKALAEAVTRYEGAKMFIDHRVDTRGNRSIQDFGGIYKNVRLDGAKLRADLHLLESKRSTVMAIAKMKPEGIGFSIKDKGYGVEKDGVLFVEGFAPKTDPSIDLVVGPSVNKNLWESEEIKDEGGNDMDIKTLTVEQLGKERPDLIESVQNAGKAAILKELEESQANGKKSETMAAKLAALIEADFPKELSESVKKMIMADDISVETAKAIITGQKALVESITKANAKKGKAGKPHVEGMGHRQEKDVTEGADNADEIVSDEDIVGAFRRR